MKRLFYIFNVLLLVGVLFTGCSGDEESVDLIKPTADISLAKENGIYSPGASIVINGEFFDETALKECQVTVVRLKGWDTDWEPEMYKVELSGKYDELKGQQVLENIPFDIAYGNYQLKFTVLDQANNNSEYYFDIEIR